MKENSIRVLCEENRLHQYGRTAIYGDGLALFYTGSGIGCDVRAAELWLELEAHYSAYEPWISIWVDDVMVSRLMLTEGRHSLCLFRGMNPEVVKRIKVLKDVQAMSGDTAHALLFHSLRTDGEILPAPVFANRIEFIGDSITSGEGAIGAKQEEDWISMWFSVENNYAHMIATDLNADFRIVSQSGWGVHSSWDNDPKAALPKYYRRVCGLAGGAQNEAYGAQRENDFTAWQPDLVVINLGTNDMGAFTNPPYTDPETGLTYKQHMNEDGSFCEADIEVLKADLIAFLKELRACNPQAQLLWVYGMLGAPLLPAIQDAVERYQKETKDARVSVLLLPDTTEESVGARWHPGRLSHRRAADTIIAKVRAEGWLPSL